MRKMMITNVHFHFSLAFKEKWLLKPPITQVLVTFSKKKKMKERTN
jgi:hypothetical protein